MSAKPVVVLATRNAGKIAELSSLLSGFGLTVLGLADFPQAPEVEETGATFSDNALLKARSVSRALGLVAVADDSCLEVYALAGRPGVFSARYAGENATDAANNEKLLAELAGVPEQSRTARFVCVMAAVRPDGGSITARGTWEGRIAAAPRGANGFGYDPVFFDPELQKTAAELDRADKNARSHRGRALRALIEQWPGFWRG